MTTPEGSLAARSRSGPDPRKVWTVLELLRWTTDHFAAQGIESARLDAECLLAHALGSSRLGLYLDFEKPVAEPERAVFREQVRRRASLRVPVAQLVSRSRGKGEAADGSLAAYASLFALPCRKNTAERGPPDQ